MFQIYVFFSFTNWNSSLPVTGRKGCESLEHLPLLAKEDVCLCVGVCMGGEQGKWFGENVLDP